jgi:UTP--glucose-1-phosphate uridylyltransferase
LTDAMRLMLQDRAIYGLVFDGARYDIGNKLDFLKTNVVFGLHHPELGPPFREFLKGLRETL